RKDERGQIRVVYFGFAIGLFWNEPIVRGGHALPGFVELALGENDRGWKERHQRRPMRVDEIGPVEQVTDNSHLLTRLCAFADEANISLTGPIGHAVHISAAIGTMERIGQCRWIADP